jgi:hypothetical protein
MDSGGLSGTFGMRMYGIGMDQVVHLEMMLPLVLTSASGHRPGSIKRGMNTPKRKKLPAIAMPILHLPMACKETIDFQDLWFAVRGGGGGTYGIVTSLHYQLHDYTGRLQFVSARPNKLPEFDGWDDTNAYLWLLYMSSSY